jgi:predicted nucleotidyltransferase/DNA-binding XRE family transcriptional regulator
MSADPRSIRERRLAAGLTQRALAARSGVPQPNIAAYERGRRIPTSETLERLDGALRVPTLTSVKAARDRIVEAATLRGLSDVRIFGSVARDTATSSSDIDLLVHPGPSTSVFDLAGFMHDVEDILDVTVDVVSDRGSGPIIEHIRAEAVPL